MKTLKLPSLDITQGQAKELLKELTAFVEKEEGGCFVPKVGEGYWYNHNRGHAVNNSFDNMQVDREILENNRVYRTKEECGEGIKINQARIRIEKAHAEVCGDWEFDKTSIHTANNFAIEYDSLLKKLRIYADSYVLSYGQIYFPSKDIAEQFAEMHKEDLLLVLNSYPQVLCRRHK